MLNTMIRPINTANTDRTRVRALEIVCTLYRCTTNEAAALLVEHSQTNNIKVANLAKALVTLIDDSTSTIETEGSSTLAAHFWLREIRNLNRSHRRTDNFQRHFARSAA